MTAGATFAERFEIVALAGEGGIGAGAQVAVQLLYSGKRERALGLLGEVERRVQREGA